MATSEADIAAQLIERLLGDPTFRAQFRRDPAAACRAAGLDELADEMSLGAGKAMMTLDVRESKSSLAGVMMAAAMEGVGVYQFGEHVLPHLDDVPGAVSDVLSRVSLPALPGRGALSGGAEPQVAPPAAAEPEADGAAAAAGGGGGAAAAAAAPEAPPEPVLPPEDAAAKGKDAAEAAKAAAEKAEKAEPVVPPEQAAAQKIAAAESPEAKQAEKIEAALDDIKEQAEDLPSASDVPDSGVAPATIEESGPDAGHDHAGHDHGAEAPAAPAPAAPVAPPEAVQPAPTAPPVEPAGGGGTGDAAAEALLQNKNLVLDADAQGDIRSGDVDPRMIALLGKLTEDHKIELSVIKTGHDQFTSGGSVSNHFVGRGIDIARVDGEIVNPGSPAARELATTIAEMTGDLRPTEVGTPWSIGASGFFTDGAHQDHLHVAFDGEPPPGFEAPAAPQAAAPAAAAAAIPGQPAVAAGQPVAAAAAAPEAKPGDSMAFQAVTAKQAAEAAEPPKKGDSMAFRAVPGAAAQAQQPPGPVAAVAAEPAVPGVTDLSGAPTEYPGDDAAPELRAAWMAAEAQKRGLPPELPVMASLVESGMKNLNFGDADSVGFFQMRVGIWNQGDYAGYPEKPELQLKWFFDQAEAVKKQRLAAGEPLDKSNYGNWIADIERPAEQYRYRYGERLEEAEGLLAKAPKGPAAAPLEAVAQPGAPAAPVEAAAGGGGARQPIDPDQFGGEGSGGTPDPEAQALLKNKNVVLDSVGVKDIKEGRIDPRVVAVLTKLSQDHKITVSCMCSDHSKFTSGGSISNHHHGRGLDIAAIDGEIVNSGSAIAREIAMELQDLDPDYRPNEIGTPWAISGPGYFTDAGHQDHLHVGFKEEIDPSWKPPADVAAGGAQAAALPGQPAAVPGQPAVAAAAVPGQPVAAAAAAPAVKPDDSMSFRAVTAKQAAEAAEPPKKGDSMAFRAVQPPAGPASALAPAGTAPAAVADAAAATAAGGSSLGASALEVAQKEFARGVHEEGTNTGADVDKYLAAAGVAPGNPWCASFITWSLEQSGHKMEGGGWAAVQTWVRNAEAGNNNLEIVSAADARPGDLVAYDWGGQEDFGADGHIGFLASNVQGDKFTALEGNYQDAVLKVPRQLGDANVKFIRVKGDAPAALGGQAPAVQPAAAVQPAVPVQQAAPVQPGGGSGAAADALAGSANGAGGAKAQAAIEEAKKYLGDAYVWGGSTPETGFDCSGLMQWAYAQAGVKIPRVTYDQVDVGTEVSESGIRPGDLVFFGDKDSPHHVGMALGDGKFLHAPKTGDVVKISSLDEDYWKSSLSSVRRVDESAGAAAPAAPAAAPVVPPEAVAAAAPAAPAVDPAEVAKAQAAVAREAAEVRRHDSMLFMAVKEQEAHKHRVTVQFMKAIDPNAAKAAAGPQAGAPVAAAAAVAGAPSAADDASMVQAVGAPVPANELAVLDVGPVGTYPGDNASQAQLAQWLASEAKAAGLPPELPVMASLVESGVKNLKGGDADSAGFFQMRVSIWDSGAYQGYRQDPRLQAKWFIDNALAVKKKAIAAGDVNFGKNPNDWGDWIADVERPAAQYRYKYQTRLGEARGLLGG